MSNIKKKLTLGEKIKKARKEMGYSQKEMGDLLKLSDKAVSAYEVGRAAPSLDTIKEIGKMTHKPTAYFMEDADTDDIELHIKIKTIERELLEIKQLLKKRTQG